MNREVLEAMKMEEEKQRRDLADVAEWEIVVVGVEEGEAEVLGGEDVGVVDAVVAGGAEGGVVGGAEKQRLVFVADVALNLHLRNFLKLRGNRGGGCTVINALNKNSFFKNKNNY